MVNPNITNSISFKRRLCSFCGNTAWKEFRKDEAGKETITVFKCGKCGVLIKVHDQKK